MGLKSHEGYADKAILGERARDHVLIDGIANKINSLLNPPDQAAAKKVNGEAIKIVLGLAEPGEWATDQVSVLIDAARDKNRLANMALAEERLNVLALSTYIAIKYGDDVDAARMLESGSAMGIDRLLPEPLEGLGERVRNVEIKDEGIRDVLNELDTKGRVSKMMGRGGEKKLRDNLDNAVDQLSEIAGKLDVNGRLELDRVAAYLGYEMEMLEPGVSQVNELSSRGGELLAEEEYFEALKQYQLEEGKLRHEVAEVSLTEWVDAQVSINAPRERAPQLWEYKPPEWMDGVPRKQWRMLLNLADGMLAGTYQKRKDGGYKTSLEMVKKNSMAMMELPEEDFNFLLEHPILKGGEVGHEIFRELMVPLETRANIDGREVVSRTFVFPYTTDEKGKRFYGGFVDEFAKNPTTYKKGLAERLVEKKIIGDIEAAKLSVALICDALEVGGVFSGADRLRKLSWDSDAVRLAQRPADKFNAKIREMWGGTWSAYCKAVADGDTDKALRVAEDLGIMPKLLAGSFLDVQKQDGKSWAEKMYDGEKIDMGKSSDDLYFIWRKDSLNAACDIMMYVTKEKPLQFKSFAEPDNVVSDWIASLYNSIKALRENGASLLPVETICGAFGGSVGVWPFEGPYFRISALNDPKRHMNYFSIGTEVVRQLGLSDVDEKRFLQFFGVDKRYFVDFNDKMTDYSTILNPNADEQDKRERYTKGSLLKKRR